MAEPVATKTSEPADAVLDPTDAPKDPWRAPTGMPWPPLVLIGVVVVISAVVIAVQLLKPAPSGPRVLTDTVFVAAANTTCKEALGGLRPQSTDRDAVVSPAQIADQANTAADGLAGLQGRIRGLSVAVDQQQFVAGWMDDWGTFIDAGRRYAAAVRTGDVQGANKVGRSGDPAQRRADGFARGNDLSSCLLQHTLVAPKRQGAF